MSGRRPRTVAIIQARMGSSRLPGKVMAGVEGQPMIVRVAERSRRAEELDEVAVATSTDSGDDVIQALCRSRGIACFRGHPTDVLARYIAAAGAFRAEVVVRLTGDCPLIDPGVIDRTVSAFRRSAPPAQYASNRLVRTYPIGLDVEVVAYAALLEAGEKASAAYQREHVTPFFYERPGDFRLVSVVSGGDYGALRWTVDTAEDLEFVRRVYACFQGRDDFTWHEVLELLGREPELMEINAHIRQRDFREIG